MTFRMLAPWLLTGLLLAFRSGTSADDLKAQPVDTEYTAKIREYTTEPFFLTELVDHLPQSETVPSPKKSLGYVVGTPEKLTYTKDINAYFHALAAASPRVKLWTIGKSEGGREMILAAISSEKNLGQIDRYKQITAKLADPRKSTLPSQPRSFATPNRSTGSLARFTRPRPARPRCSWSWHTGSPSKSPHTSRRFATT